MLSKDILVKSLLILSACFLFFPGSDARCTGKSLSIYNISDINRVRDLNCKIVEGDIVIRGIENPQFLPAYSRIVAIYGSIIIENTIDLGESVKFLNLILIDSGKESAIVIGNNRNLKLNIGSNLKKVINSNMFTYIMLDNGILPIDKGAYNLLHLAAYPHSSFAMNNDLGIPENHELYYKVLASFFGFFAVFLTLALTMIWLYTNDRVIQD